jgi:hypothetical protein
MAGFALTLEASEGSAARQKAYYCWIIKFGKAKGLAKQSLDVVILGCERPNQAKNAVLKRFKCFAFNEANVSLLLRSRLLIRCDGSTPGGLALSYLHSVQFFGWQAGGSIVVSCESCWQGSKKELTPRQKQGPAPCG